MSRNHLIPAFPKVAIERRPAAFDMDVVGVWLVSSLLRTDPLGFHLFSNAYLPVGLASYGSRAIIHQSGSQFRVVGFRLS